MPFEVFGGISTFNALAHRKFRLYWIGFAVANLGYGMQQLGVGWLVVELAIRDGAPQLAAFYIGLVSIAGAVPGLVFGVFGGVFADRMDRRKLCLFTQMGGCATATTLAILTLTGRVDIVSVMILTAVSAALSAINAPTQMSMLPRLVGPEDLISAVGLNNATFNSAAFVGPLLGGLLIGPFGIGGLLVINALSYLAAVAAVLGLDPQPPTDARRSNVLQQLREGLAFAIQEPVLRWVVGLSVAQSMFARPLLILTPAVAQSLGGGAVQLSWLLGALGFGALLGSIAGASLGGVSRRGIVLAAGMTSVGLANATFALQQSLGMALVVGVLPGLFHFITAGMGQALMQLRAPDHLRGRVMSLYLTSVIGVQPIGAFVLGGVGAAVGIHTALFGGGAALALVGLYALLRSRTLRELRT